MFIKIYFVFPRLPFGIFAYAFLDNLDKGCPTEKHFKQGPDYKRIAPPTFVAQLPLQRALMMAVMLSKWKVNVLESVYQENKGKCI